MYIELENVTKVIKNVTVINNVSLRFETGKVYGLEGRNGSGKTMLMRLISGLVRPTSGKININGKILHKDLKFPDSIGLLIENPFFLNNYTGYENLNLLCKIKNKVSNDDIRKAMTDITLDPDDKRKLKKYSLGMKQKLGIACAVMEKPEIIILDEPFNALDDDGILALRKIINFAKKNSIIIMTCHDHDELISLTDHIVRIENGNVYQGVNLC